MAANRLPFSYGHPLRDRKQIRIQDVSTRVQLQQLADATVARSSTYSEYRDHFEAAGVELVPILQKDDA